MGRIVAQIQSLLRNGRIVDLLLPPVILGSLLVLFVPLDPALLDVLLSLNIAVSVVILLTTLFVTKPLDFSIFPSILLATTLFRLVLNIATTRMILARAPTYQMFAAGGVVKSFSEFVSGDNVVIGLIIFVIIIVIQFVVITKGATRVAEVAARFTLDKMPGMQMAIDADLNAGAINEQEAKRRREEITQSADFFGAMDGAGKFVRGDAIAGIVITAINILGGLFIGMVQNGMPLVEALSLFTRLTIGDGLVSQVPALLISLATGFLVTRSSLSTNMPQQFFAQMLSRPIVLVLTAIFLVILTTTSLPPIPLWAIALSSLGLAFIAQRKAGKPTLEEVQQAEAAAAEKAKAAEETVEDYLKVEPMEIELGLGLIPIADPAKGGDLLDRIHRMRKEVAAEIGIILPRVRVRDSFSLDQIQYQIKIAGQPIAGGVAYPDLYLAIDSGMAVQKVAGIETIDPAFGAPALWIDEATKDQAEVYGYTVVEPGAVVATHLLETIRKHADEILTRDATQKLLEELGKDAPNKESPTVVEVLKVLSVGQIHQVLQHLLREQVPIRQLGTILETLGDYGARTKDPTLLTTYVRTKLARTICSKYRDANNTIHAVALDPALEDQIRSGFEHTEQGGLYSRLSQNAIDHFCKKIIAGLEALTSLNLLPVVLVEPRIRAALKLMTSSTIPGLIILSHSEITHDTRVEIHGVVS